MFNLLVIDDDKLLLDEIKIYFEKLKYNVICVETSKQALETFYSTTFDCIILDINLPDCNGFDLFSNIREEINCPIVFLSGYTEEKSRVKGLTIGGDDYVCKPCSLIELELRVKARITANNSLHLAKTLKFDELIISQKNYSVTYNDEKIDFSTQEFDVLFFLASHPNTVFTYEEIHEKVWKKPLVKGLKSVQMTIVRIRKKLIDLSPNHDYLQTIRNKGYLFIP